MLKRFFYYLLPAVVALSGCGTGTGKSADATATLFTLLPAEQTGVDFQNLLTEGLNTNILMYEYFYNGGGVAVGDLNQDGLPDLYFTSNMSDNKCYLNKGNLRFEDITEQSRVAGRAGPWKTGVTTVDINGDGKLDIYLCYSGAMPEEKRANQLFINRGNNANGVPQFEEAAAQYGLAHTGFSNQAYFFDYDLDGDLDMLLLNHNPKNLPILNRSQTQQLFAVDNPEKGIRLFQQQNGKFTDVTTAAGINGSELCYGLGIGISDFNGDGLPDFYVSNDYAVPDYLYINQGNGVFANTLPGAMGHTSQFSMGNDVADMNNDGFTDLFTLDMLPEDNRRQKLLLAPDNYEKFLVNLNNGFYYQYMRNMLHRNIGNGQFSEIGQQAGVSNTDWSWSALFADFDNDGYKDLHVTNGYVKDFTNLDFVHYMNSYIAEKGRMQRSDVMDIIKEMPSSDIANYIFKNNKESGFDKVTEDWGLNRVSNSNGAAYADLDNDGDLDLIVNNINEPAFIYRNNSTGKSFLTVDLVGKNGNIKGVGAKVHVFYAGGQQVLEQYPTRGYLSSVSDRLHFGLDTVKQIDSLRVVWNSGAAQTLKQVAVNRVLELREENAAAAKRPAERLDSWFKEIKSPLLLKFSDSLVNDFNRQSLLLHQFSDNRACLIKADVNGDGLEDIVAGAPAGEAAALYLQERSGGFQKRVPEDFVADKHFHDAAIAVLDANGDEYPDLYFASGGYHQLQVNDPLLQDRLYLNDGKGNFSRSTGLPTMLSSSSCVAVGDVNADGKPDLFVGGGVVPGRYPETPASFLLINEGNGTFSDATSKWAPGLSKAGMLTSALFSDLDGNGEMELVIAGEWVPIQIYEKQNNVLTLATEKFMASSPSGFWNTVYIQDFNDDGKPDLLAGNLGNNTQIRISQKEPAELFYADFDGNGSVDPIFNFYIQQVRFPYLTRDELIGQLPVMRKRFSTFKSYADITTDQLFLNGELNKAGRLEAIATGTTLFLSGGDGKLSPAQLPAEVQYAPVHVIYSADFDKDGKQDLLLAGNSSKWKLRLGKMDANPGVVLKGLGGGRFSYVAQTVSGFSLSGDVRCVLPVGNKLLFAAPGKSLTAYQLNR